MLFILQLKRLQNLKIDTLVNIMNAFATAWTKWERKSFIRILSTWLDYMRGFFLFLKLLPQLFTFTSDDFQNSLTISLRWVYFLKVRFFPFTVPILKLLNPCVLFLLTLCLLLFLSYIAVFVLPMLLQHYSILIFLCSHNDFIKSLSIRGQLFTSECFI